MGVKRVKKDEFEYFRKKVRTLNGEVIFIQRVLIMTYFVIALMAMRCLILLTI